MNIQELQKELAKWNYLHQDTKRALAKATAKNSKVYTEIKRIKGEIAQIEKQDRLKARGIKIKQMIDNRHALCESVDIALMINNVFKDAPINIKASILDDTDDRFDLLEAFSDRDLEYMIAKQQSKNYQEVQDIIGISKARVYQLEEKIRRRLQNTRIRSLFEEKA